MHVAIQIGPFFPASEYITPGGHVMIDLSEWWYRRAANNLQHGDNAIKGPFSIDQMNDLCEAGSLATDGWEVTSIIYGIEEIHETLIE